MICIVAHSCTWNVFTLDDLFSSLEVDEKDEDDIISRGIYSTTPLVSPYYSEDDPLDNEALYSSLCALRRAHTSPPPVVASDDVKGLSCAELFSPAEVTDGEKEDTDLESIVYQGLHKLFALLPF